MNRLDAIAFNALSKALGDVDRFVSLTERQKVASTVLAAVLPEHERQVGRLTATIDQIHGFVDHSPDLSSVEVVMKIQELLHDLATADTLGGKS